MKYSIIVPVFNPPQVLLDRCICSLKGNIQRLRTDAECILVNDGSTEHYIDRTLQEIAVDSRFKYIRKANGGVSSARNVGIEIATGEYVTFVDSDDFLEDDMLEYADKILSEHHFDMMMLGAVRDQEGYKEKIRKHVICEYRGKEVEKVICHQIRYDGFLYSIGVHKSAIHAKFYKSDILKNQSIRFSEDLPFSEDIYFNIEYLRHVGCLYIDNHLAYHYVINIQSAVNSFNPQRIGICNLVMKKLSDYVSLYYPNNKSFHQALRQHVVISIRNSMQSYFTHLQNKKPFKVRKKELAGYLSCPINKQLINELEFEDGTDFWMKRDIFLLKTNKYWLLLITELLKKKIRKSVRNLKHIKLTYGLLHCN